MARPHPGYDNNPQTTSPGRQPRREPFIGLRWWHRWRNPGAAAPGVPGDRCRRGTVLALKGTASWKSWLDGFAAHCHLGLADTVEQSLVSYAKERDYPPPPKR